MNITLPAGTQTDATFRVGVHRRVYNATLREAIAATGQGTRSVAEALGVTYWTLLSWLRCHAYPSQEMRLRCA